MLCVDFMWISFSPNVKFDFTSGKKKIFFIFSFTQTSKEGCLNIERQGC